ncbi:hypothetical protein C6Y14_00855 [Streptomyces dioscori]|uniref:Uncharacterized protein n=1 Tax=Streptomyces dioscori TaxID=2109333 RepID=A0A2P8QEP4_9ACTN|nr:hypothetical protein [Streptomyces dioscori]PSM44721.1 hypothetical protein C6Y14_00855 [Streptomyces dioscori]
MRGGCLFKGCLAVPVLALVCVVVVMVSFWNTGREADAEARDQVEEAVDNTRARLARSAADGVLLDTEIQRAVRNFNKTTPLTERRERRVTVTARFAGMVNVGFGGTHADGCYRFDVVPATAVPSVAVRELPGKDCLVRSDRSFREPSAVAEDIVAELRTAMASGGPEAARTAEVWSTLGVELADSEIRSGQLIALVRLSGSVGPQGEDCFEFRARRAQPAAVTVKKLKPDGCHRLQRERDAQAEKDRRAELGPDAG